MEKKGCKLFVCWRRQLSTHINIMQNTGLTYRIIKCSEVVKILSISLCLKIYYQTPKNGIIYLRHKGVARDLDAQWKIRLWYSLMLFTSCLRALFNYLPYFLYFCIFDQQGRKKFNLSILTRNIDTIHKLCCLGTNITN